MGHQTALKLQGEVYRTVLLRCGQCGAPHPRARNLDSETCPDCGSPAARPLTKKVPGTIVGLWLGRILLALGRFFMTLARGIS